MEAGRGGNHRVPHNMIQSRYMTRDNDNIMIQRFYDNRYITRQSHNDTSRYLSNYENKMPVKRLSAGFLSLLKSTLEKVFQSVN